MMTLNPWSPTQDCQDLPLVQANLVTLVDPGGGADTRVTWGEGQRTQESVVPEEIMVTLQQLAYHKA